MQYEHFQITINGQKISDLYPDLVRLEVEQDEDLATMFRLYFGIALGPNGIWSLLDDQRLQIWQPLSITVRLGQELEELINGYITHVKPMFGSEITKCMLEVWGMDGSVLMDRQEKLKDWPNQKDSDIAAAIFSQYGFTPKIENTTVIHDEAISTTIQRETDMQFLRRLARRNGFECYVEGKQGIFRSPQLQGSPQPVLAVHFGKKTNVQEFSLDVDALAPAQVQMAQVDRTTKEILTVTTKTTQQQILGKTEAQGFLGPGLKPGKEVVGRVITTGMAEMTALCQGLYDQDQWFVTGEGQILGRDYGHVLRARQTVTIKGIGETYSGVYYVTHVTHSISAKQYIQRFQVKRNALLPAGTEKFSV
jgi:phage protein D